MNEAIIKAGPIPYDIDYKVYYLSGQVFSDCNEILFINYGTAAVIIDSVVTLQQGQSFSITANAGEITHKQFTVAFGTGTNQLAVVRKTYIRHAI